MTKSLTSSAELTARRNDNPWPLPGDIWPVYSGKSFNIWEPDTTNYYESVNAFEITQHLSDKRYRQHKIASSAYADIKPNVISDRNTLPCLRPRIAFRDITNPTNQRTMIAALIPPGCVTTESAPFLLRICGGPDDEAFLVAVLSSTVLDWQARRIVELHMKFANLNSLSIPDPGAGHVIRDRVTEIGGRLAAIDNRFCDWAAEIGAPVGSASDPGVKWNLIAELDACVGILFGFDEEDLEVIYSTFHRGSDYSELKDAVLGHFQRLRRESPPL